MSYLSKFIDQIEKHTGEKFDFNSRKHKFHLKQKIAREINSRDEKLKSINSVLNLNHSTYNPKEKKTIYLSSKERI